MLGKEHFKSEMERMREQSERFGCKLVVPQFMLEPGGLKQEWLIKWWNMLTRIGMTDEELTKAVDFTFFRRSKELLTYYPTDDEFRRLIENMREIEQMKEGKAAKPERTKSDAKPRRGRRWYSGPQYVGCSDCGGTHLWNQMCPVMYPETAA